MPLYTFSGPELALTPMGRLRRTPPLGWLLLVLGLAALVYVGFRLVVRHPASEAASAQHSLLNLVVAPLYAQGVADSVAHNPGPDLKQKVMVGIVCVLGLLLLTSFAAVLFAKDTTKVGIAGDILKTLLGFFIGLATSFFSV